MAPLPVNVKTSLPLSRAEHWTLHHVLLHRIERESATPGEEPPPTTVYCAFEMLDAGETAFTDVEFEAIQSVLAEYHHSTDWWESERAQIESLLYQIIHTRGTASRLQSA
ncbi:DUF7853 family protein [Halalkalicoccus salilacus]